MTRFLLRLWTYVRPYKLRLFLGLLSGVLFALTNGAVYLMIKLIIELMNARGAVPADDVLARLPQWMRPGLESFLERLNAARESGADSTIMLAVCAIPVVALCWSLFNYLNVYLVHWASTRAIADLRTTTFAHLQRLPVSFFTENNTGELMSRITSDTQTLRTIIGTSLASLLRDPITILFLAGLLLTQQPVLTMFALIVLPLCIIPVTIYGRKVRKSARAVQDQAAGLSRLMQESFSGNRIIKAYNLEDQVLKRFREITQRFVNQTMRVVKANEIPSAIMEFLGGIGIALVLLYVLADRTRSPGDFGAFIGAVVMMYKPIKMLTRLHNQLQQARAASQRVFELLDTTSTVLEPAAPVPLNAANADIHFDDIDFNYGEKPVLHGINLTVKAGHLVALVGSSGSGKTTLTNLLLRFYDPVGGAIRIGNTDIRQVSTGALRDQIALVTQETILFHDTIRQNILLGRPDATEVEIVAAAQAANAHKFILEKPNGYDSVVGERGIALSGGQRQRIAIARALLKNAPILVLDEATSSLDTESERAVQSALETLMEGRTTICIAHRLSTIQRADLIVVLSEGCIIETGTHEELLERAGVYQRLYELQFQA